MRTERTFRDAWYGQPVVWLGALVLGASLAGGIGMIALAAKHADVPLPTAGGRILKVPLAQQSAASDAPGDGVADVEATRPEP